MQRGSSRPGFEGSHIQFGLGLAAAGYDADISRRLFSFSFQQLADGALKSVVDDPLGRLRELPVNWETAQDRRRVEAGPTHDLGAAWSIETTWDGTVGLYWVQAVTNTRIEHVVEHGLRPAWAVAEAILEGLGPRGSRHLTVIFAGAMFPRSIVTPTPEAFLPTVSRGPLRAGVYDDILAGITRELSRAVGWMEFEPDC